MDFGFRVFLCVSSIFSLVNASRLDFDRDLKDYSTNRKSVDDKPNLGPNRIVPIEGLNWQVVRLAELSNGFGCVLNTNCPHNLRCSYNHCVDPCVEYCGINANCRVTNHMPVCSCKESYTGDPYDFCRPIPVKVPPRAPRSPHAKQCDPSPCGPHSTCRSVDIAAICACQPGYSGIPPECRPECVSSSECAPSEACVNLKCQDPCPGTCGRDAKCQVVNHNPICVCPSGRSGDPLTGCHLISTSCKDDNVYCSSLATAGYCSSSPSYMHNYCKKSCEIC